MSAARICRRMAGRLGCGGGPAPALYPMLFPPEPQVLQESEGELAQERGVVQAVPQSLRRANREHRVLLRTRSRPCWPDDVSSLRRPGVGGLGAAEVAS